MKQPLPAKYSKMTVCTFWILKELKNIGIINDEQLAEGAKHFHLSEETEDQMLFYRDVVENFKEHENYLKMFAIANRLSANDEICEKTEEEKSKEKSDEKVPGTKIISTKSVQKKKKLSDMDVIGMLLEPETETENYTDSDCDSMGDSVTDSVTESLADSMADSMADSYTEIKPVIPLKRKLILKTK